MASKAPSCSDTAPAAKGLPEVYYPLHSLLHTLRSLERHQDQICTLLTAIQRTGTANAGLRRELTALLHELPAAAFDHELQDVWSALEKAA